MLGRSFILCVAFTSVTLAQQIGSVGDWPDWRGPDRNGVSREKNLPDKWSLAGQNLAWKAHYGGRSAPVILGDHLYLQNTASARETEQERVMCFNAALGSSTVPSQRTPLFYVLQNLIRWFPLIAPGEQLPI